MPYVKLLTQRLLTLPIAIKLLDKVSSDALIPFSELIEKNMKYVDKETLEWYPIFLQVEIDFLEYENETIGFEKIPMFRKVIFLLLASNILQQTSRIAHELGLPDPTITFPSEYTDNDHIMKYLILATQYSTDKSLK